MSDKSLIPIPKTGDLESVRRSLMLLAGNRGVGPGSSPTFNTINITNLSTSDQIDLGGVQAWLNSQELKLYPRTKQALATFVFDDGFATDYSVMKPVFDAQGEVACSAIISGEVGDSGRLTSSQITALEDAGWEILSHSDDGTALTTKSLADAETSMSTSKTTLEGYGWTIKNFVWPGGLSNENLRRICSKYYRSARGTNSHTAADPIEQFSIDGVSADDHTALATYQGYVDTADTNSDWIIFLLHETDSDDATTIGSLIDYIQGKGISIVTIDQGLDITGNQIYISGQFEVGPSGVRIPYLTNGVKIQDEARTDYLKINHDGSNANLTTSDGVLNVTTDEAATNMILAVKGYSTTNYGELRTYDEANDEWVSIYASSGSGYIGTKGSSPQHLYLQNDAHANVILFNGSTEGETRELKILGYRTGDSKRTLEIGVGRDAADCASFDGLSSYRFDGELDADTLNLINQDIGLQFDNVSVFNVKGAGNIFIGPGTPDGTSFNYAVCIGEDAGGNLGHTTGAEGYNNTFIGYQAGLGTTNNYGAYNLGIGYQSLTAVTTATYNVGIGDATLHSLTEGIGNIAIGANSLYDVTGGDYNVAIGTAALFDCTGDYNIAVGYRAGYQQTTATHTIAIGYRSVYDATTAGYNIGIGTYALTNVTTSYNVAIGPYCLYTSTADTYNVGIGYYALYDCDGGSNNMAIGGVSLTNVTTGDNNVAVGTSSGFTLTTGGNNIFLGYRAGYLNSTGSGCVCIGYQAGYNETGSNKLYIDNSNTATPLIYGDFDTNALTINGTLSATGAATVGSASDTTQLIVKANASQTVSNPLLDLQDSSGTSLLWINSNHISNIMIGYRAGDALTLTGGSNGLYNVLIGLDAGTAITTGYGNVAIGRLAAAALTDGFRNFALGESAMSTGTSASYNLVIGNDAGGPLQGQYNVLLGDATLGRNTTSDANVMIGYWAGRHPSSTQTYDNCVFIGYKTGLACTASNNIFIGYQAGDNVTSGANNLILGYDIDAKSATASNQVNIAGIYRGDSSAKRTYIACPTTTATDANMNNSEVSVWVNEAGNALTFKVKYSSGTVKSGTVSLT